MSNYTLFTDLRTVSLADPGHETWIDLASVGKYQHPLYGEIDFSPQKLQEFEKNFNDNVRGIDIAIDYDHSSGAGNTEAAGWIKKVVFDKTLGKLRGLVKFTDTAFQKIKEGAYRYFSPEYRDEWENATGTKFKNVLFGGGITNRPFLKDLLPINLSELTFNEPPTQEPPKENEVDPKQLSELAVQIGLSADATQEQVDARCALIKQLAEAFPQGPPKPDPTPEPPKPPAPAPTMPEISISDDLKKLAETNPNVKGLVDIVQGLVEVNVHNTKTLREQTVTMKLSEFDRSKIVLSPVARDLVMEIMTDDRMPVELSEKVWELLGLFKTSAGAVVELGERAGGRVSYGQLNGGSADAQFNSKVALKLSEAAAKGTALDAITAMEEVAREDPDLYNRYRSESYIVNGA
jgi:hypothetical protein